MVGELGGEALRVNWMINRDGFVVVLALGGVPVAAVWESE